MQLSQHLQKKLHKQCKSCRIMKPLTGFFVQKNTADGKRGVCKACWNDYNQGLEVE